MHKSYFWNRSNSIGILILSEQAQDAEAKQRKSRRDIIAGTGIFLYGLFGVIYFVLSLTGYVPSIPVDPEHPYYLSPFTWCISFILMVVLGLYVMVRGYRRRIS